MEDKFQRGLRQLAEAGHDKDKLGMSLISLHGALEEYFRSQLATEIAIDENEQGRRRTDWQDLLNLWQRHRSLSYHDRELIFAKNGKRNAVAHGDPFEISQSEMEQYAQFVQNFMGVRATSRPAYKPPVQSQPKAKWTCRRRLAVVSVIILMLSCWPLLSFSDTLEPLFEENPTRLPGRGTRIILTDEVEAEKPVEEETAVTAQPSPLPTSQSGKEQIQVVKGATNVRSEPGVEFEVISTAPDEAVYDVLETSANGNWYKIEITHGQEGWIGSSRVEKISP